MTEQDFKLAEDQLAALVDGVPHLIANLANAAALLWGMLDDVNWAGFYLREGNTLVLGPFQGKPACIEIPIGRGVCGTAAERNETQVVPDVLNFPGHIACDAASRSEIVVPLHDKAGRVAGVLDIDSARPGRFSEADKRGLEGFARVLEAALAELL